MLAIPVVFASAIALATTAQALPPTYGNDTGASPAAANFTFLPPSLEPYIHVEFNADVPTNTSTVLGLVGRAPNVGGNVTGEITGTILPVGAADELIPDGPNGIRTLYHNQWSINISSISAGTDDGSATVVMTAHSTNLYANEAVFGQGLITFQGAPGTNLTYEQFVGQVSADYNTGVGYLDVFKIVSVGRVDGQSIKALLPAGEDGGA